MDLCHPVKEAQDLGFQHSDEPPILTFQITGNGMFPCRGSFSGTTTMQLSYVGSRGLHLQNIRTWPRYPELYRPGVNTAGLNIPAGDTCRQFFSIVNMNGNGNGNAGFRPYMSYFGQATSGQAQFPVMDFSGNPSMRPCKDSGGATLIAEGQSNQFSYTWSKTLALQGIQGLIGQGNTDIFSDNTNPRLDYGPSGFRSPAHLYGLAGLCAP